MNDSTVAQHHPFLNVLRHIVVGVQHAAVLNVDSRTQGDFRQIAADDRCVPDVYAGAQRDLAGHHGADSNVVILDRLHGKPA